jgi:ElaB/YqjD/DUF883 family membrane-anchored ribosome-binding protein
MDTLSMDRAREKLVSDFKSVVLHVESLLKATADQGGKEVEDVRERVEASLEGARRSLHETQTDLMMQTREAAKATDLYVRSNPWQAMGLAAGVGLVLGLVSSKH